MTRVHVYSREDFEAEAARFVGTLMPRREGATLVTLSGELGAGKTTFVQAIARTLGVSESVTSPTFVLENIYSLPESAAFKRLVHIDAYRLQGVAALTPLGFEELAHRPENLILLEWPEQVDLDATDRPTVRIAIEVNDDDSRTITYGN